MPQVVEKGIDRKIAYFRSIARLVANMRVFGMVVKIFRMPNTMFSTVEFSVSIR